MQRAFNVGYIYWYLPYWKLKQFQNKNIQAHVPFNLHTLKTQEKEWKWQRQITWYSYRMPPLPLKSFLERETYCVLMNWLRDILGTFHKKGDNKYYYFISKEMGKVVDSSEITYGNKLFMAGESLKYLNTITVFKISYLSL